MKHPHMNVQNWPIPLLLGIASWTFFGVFYRYHLHYQEQVQLFQSTYSCFSELISFPGGVAIYIGRFFTQFFYEATVGALLISLLLILLQCLTWDAITYIIYKPVYRLLSCLPSVLYWILLCDENVLLSGLIAFILSLTWMAFYNRIPNSFIRIIFLLLSIPVLYWLVGYAAFIFPVLAFITEYYKKELISNHLAIIGGISLLLIILTPLIAKAWLLQYPLIQFWLAGDYYRYILQYPIHIYFIFTFSSVIFLPVIIRYLPDVSIKKQRYISKTIQLLSLLIIATGGISKVADWKKEEVMAYDYYARTKKWYHILTKADKQTPDGPLTVSTLNLALSQTGRMPDYMFSYYQNGVQGLFPVFEKDYILAIMVGEIYYHLGLINTAQRFAFEAMETLPDYQKSVRSIKRLAETNLINGQYRVAEKYLTMLTHTFYYKKWAEDTLAYLDKEDLINEHPEWGVLRQYRPKEDFLFSEQEKDMMCGMLFQQNPNNRMAYEYLLAYTLLTKDLQRFLTYYRLGEGVIIYPVIPKNYQESLFYIWNAAHPEGRNDFPYPLSFSVKQNWDIYRSLSRSTFNEAVLKSQLGDTYWYYLHKNQTK